MFYSDRLPAETFYRGVGYSRVRDYEEELIRTILHQLYQWETATVLQSFHVHQRAGDRRWEMRKSQFFRRNTRKRAFSGIILAMLLISSQPLPCSKRSVHIFPIERSFSSQWECSPSWKRNASFQTALIFPSSKSSVPIWLIPKSSPRLSSPKSSFPYLSFWIIE